ncbi:TrmH family RNA methyltransferase [Eubacterium xylanophilum]|uniref:TrmH family RNA methyltransferase n=1 Tax=Eubacterium xylanophilum TaxID=39497 RepID=UPI00047CFCD5|nr:RNA methyltransferase [Eubacterium xylanophilum]
MNWKYTRISSMKIPELDIYRLYNENQLRKMYEPDVGIFICESPKVILRALEAGYEIISVLTAVDEPDGEAEAVYRACEDAGAVIYLGKNKDLRELAGFALTGGVLAAMRRRELPSVEKIIEGKSVVAVLENINNPTNIGAIFRSAAALGIEAVIVSSDSTDPLYRRSERVSMGTVFQVPWTRAPKKVDYMKALKDGGFTTVAMALSENSVGIDDARIKECGKLAIVLGNEGYGLSRETIDRSDFVAMIPMSGKVDSLNVAAASAVMFWELKKEK